jgi:hypothetical protein
LHGVVFDIFGRSRGDPAQWQRPEGARACQAVAQIVGFGLERSKIYFNLDYAADPRDLQ